MLGALAATFMKVLLLFSAILFISCATKDNKKIEPTLSPPISSKNENKNDTLYISKDTLIISSNNHIDTLLKFKSILNDSLYLVDTSNITFAGPLDFSKYKYKKSFITVTKEGVKDNGVNFAGHFCFVYWGCGSPCKLSAVVDMKTGIVYNGLSGETGYKFKKTSKVIIVNPPDSSGWYNKNAFWEQPSQYIWTGNKFIKVKSRS
jgi:hypothetical protein